MIKYIFKNTIFLIIARIIFKVFTAGLTIVLARFLGVEKFGQYSLALAFSAIFLVFNDLGMNTYMIREASRDRSKLPFLFGNGLFIEIVMSFILYGAIMMVARILNYPQEVLTIISLIAIATLIYEGRKIFQGAFESYLKFKIIGWQQIIYSGLLFFLTIAILLTKPSLENIAYTQIFVSVVILILLGIALFKFIKPKIAVKQIWTMLSGAFAFCLSSFFFIIYFQTDTIILSVFRGDRDVGLYSSVYRLVVAIFIFSQIILRTVTPVIYRISLKEKEKLKRIYKTMLKYLAAFGIACSIGLFFLARPILLLAYGKKYEAATIILQILSWFVLIRFINSTLSTYLLSTDKQNRRAALQGVAAVLNLGLNLIFIPKWGYVAAALTTLFSEFFLALTYFMIMTKNFREKIIYFLRPILQSFLPALVLSLFLFFTKDYFNVILLAVSGVLIFGISLLVFRFFGEYDRKLIKQIIQRDTNTNFNNEQVKNIDIS